MTYLSRCAFCFYITSVLPFVPYTLFLHSFSTEHRSVLALFHFRLPVFQAICDASPLRSGCGRDSVDHSLFVSNRLNMSSEQVTDTIDHSFPYWHACKRQLDGYGPGPVIHHSPSEFPTSKKHPKYTPHPPIATGTGHYSLTGFPTYTGSYPTGYVPSFLGLVPYFGFSCCLSNSELQSSMRNLPSLLWMLTSGAWT